MSRHSQYLASKLRRMEDAADSLIESLRSILTGIENMLTENRDDWENYLPAARSTIASIDQVEYFSLPHRLAEQRRIVQVLQDYAYHDSDDGSIQDIANWCQASWLRILRDHPDDAETLTGSSLQHDNYTIYLWRRYRGLPHATH
jgi:hypothetical protein